MHYVKSFIQLFLEKMNADIFQCAANNDLKTMESLIKGGIDINTTVFFNYFYTVS